MSLNEPKMKISENEAEYGEPWERLGLTYEQWKAPMSDLTPEHRKIIFDVYNSRYKLNFDPSDFNIPKK